MSKKLNRTEIATLAKRIIEEVNEVNKAYNETVKVSPTYIAEIAKIEAKNPLKSIKESFIKELKIQFGTEFEKEVNFSLNANYNGPLEKLSLSIIKEKEDYNKSVLKPILTLDNNQQRIIDDITIAQIDITDVQLLINTIKAKLI